MFRPLPQVIVAGRAVKNAKVPFRKVANVPSQGVGYGGAARRPVKGSETATEARSMETDTKVGMSVRHHLQLCNG